MKKIVFYILLIAPFPLFWNGKPYSKSTEIVSFIDTNLIYNSSFEFNVLYNDTLRDWPNDTLWSLNHQPTNPPYAQSAPSAGGDWSLGLTPSFDSVLNNADYYIKGISGTNSYTLHLWWKISSRDSNGIVQNGFVTVGKYSNNVLSQSQSLTIANSDTIWTNDSLSFSLTTSSADSILVRLSGGIAKISFQMGSAGAFLFDKVQLIKH